MNSIESIVKIMQVLLTVPMNIQQRRRISMSSTKEILDNYIYPALDRSELLKDLKPMDKGDYYVLDCPKCNRHDAFIYKTSIIIICKHIISCGFTQSLWDYIQHKGGLSNQETLQELARLAHYDLPKQEFAKKEFNLDEKKDEILRLAMTYCRKKLFESEGKDALSYLIDERKLSEEEIKIAEIGYYPSQTAIKDYFNDNHKDIPLAKIESTGLLTRGFGDTHKLIIPWKDTIGRIVGLVARSVSKDAEPKYKYSLGMKKHIPFNIDKVIGKQNLIIVEGLFDAITPFVKGVNGVIAVGGSNLTQEQLTIIISKGSKNVLIAFDNDAAGIKATEKAIKMINDKGLNAYVIDLQECKDPDEFIMQKGVEEFKIAAENASTIALWRFNQSIRKFKNTEIEKRDFFKAAANLIPGADKLDQSKITKEAARILDVNQEYIEQEFKEYIKKQSVKEKVDKRNKKVETAVKSAQIEINSGNYAKAEKLLHDHASEASSAVNLFEIKPYRLSDAEQDIKETSPGLETGFEELDKIIKIPNAAITIIAARPSHGKTAFLMNCFLNLIKYYQGKSFFFFSYEETKTQIFIKLISILSKCIVRENDNLAQIANYIKGGNKTNEQIEQAKIIYDEYAEEKRLLITDYPYYGDDLCDVLKLLKSQYDVGAICIDYFQKIKYKDRLPARQLEIQKVSEKILETAKSLSLPIILGAQVNREVKKFEDLSLSTLREAGDIEQDANLVIGLFNPTMNEAKNPAAKLINHEIQLKLKILKNRNGPANDVIPLFFNPITQKIFCKNEET